MVVIGGGKGAAAVLSALRGKCHLTGIISATDDGGSGGWVRDHFNMIAPGDFRRALVALSHSKDEKLKATFLHRYESGPMKGQVVGNLLLASLFEQYGNFDKALVEAGKMLEVQDDIFPSTPSLTRLCAELVDGKGIRGETNIDITKGPRSPIKRLFLDPAKVKAHPKAVRAIQRADFIIFSAGDLYTSLLPNLIVPGMATAIQKSKAKTLLFVNTLNKPAETQGYRASDFINTVERYCGVGTIDAAIICPTLPASRLTSYKSKGFELVEVDIQNIPKHIKVVRASWYPKNGPIAADATATRRVLKKIIGF